MAQWTPRVHKHVSWRRPLRIEALEDRCMLSITANLASNAVAKEAAGGGGEALTCDEADLVGRRSITPRPETIKECDAVAEIVKLASANTKVCELTDLCEPAPNYDVFIAPITFDAAQLPAECIGDVETEKADFIVLPKTQGDCVVGPDEVFVTDAIVAADDQMREMLVADGGATTGKEPASDPPPTTIVGMPPDDGTGDDTDVTLADSRVIYFGGVNSAGADSYSTNVDPLHPVKEGAEDEPVDLYETGIGTPVVYTLGGDTADGGQPAPNNSVAFPAPSRRDPFDDARPIERRSSVRDNRPGSEGHAQALLEVLSTVDESGRIQSVVEPASVPAATTHPRVSTGRVRGDANALDIAFDELINGSVKRNAARRD